MKNLLIALFSLVFLAGITSCGKNEPDTGSNKTVTVKVTGSANLEIHDVIIVTVDLSGKPETKSYNELNVPEWTKDITYNNSMTVSVSGVTKDEQNGTMKVQLIDSKGNVLKESQAEGKVLVATVGN